MGREVMESEANDETLTVIQIGQDMDFTETEGNGFRFEGWKMKNNPIGIR
jgi:hypothetical protein